jgi:putative ABC transport system permease protein
MRMRYNHHVREALHNLYMSKLRTGLTLLGIMVGTASVVALVFCGQLATRHALEQFSNLGTNLFAVNIGQADNADPKNKQNLTLSQVITVAKSSPNILKAAPYTTNYMMLISSKAAPISTNVIGATDEFADIMKIKLVNGRFISYLDKTQYFCVLGYELAKKIQGNMEQASTLLGSLAPLVDFRRLIGQQIRLENVYFTIVGVAAPLPENMFLYTDINNAVIVPLSASLILNKNTIIRDVLFKLKAGSNIQKMKQVIEQSFSQQMPGAKLFSRSAKELLASVGKQRKTFALLLSAIGSISLLVGGIGVMNIMLVVVMERRREIGIRMTVGAKRHDIREMFLIESTALSLIGGVIGALVGVLTAWILATANHWGFHFYTTPLVVGFSASVLVGIISGYFPAYRASKLDPIRVLQSAN